MFYFINFSQCVSCIIREKYYFGIDVYYIRIFFYMIEKYKFLVKILFDVLHNSYEINKGERTFCL